jgi:hypothetical protein
MIAQFPGRIMSEVKAINDLEFTSSIDRHLQNGDFTQVILLDSEGLLLEEDVGVNLQEVLEEFVEGQVAVGAEQLEVEVALRHLSQGDDAALVYVAYTETVYFLTNK